MKVKPDVRIQIDTGLIDRISDAAISNGVRGATIEAERVTAYLLNQPGSGRVYKRGKIEHRASAPGEPPAPDTGRLLGSLTFETAGSRGDVSVNTEYAGYLEFGTEKMAPRPYLSRLYDFTARLRKAFISAARK